MQEEHIERWNLENEPFNFNHLEQALWTMVNYSGCYRDENVVESCHNLSIGGGSPVRAISIFKIQRDSRVIRTFWAILKEEEESDDSGLEIWLECDVMPNAKVKRIVSGLDAELRKTADWIMRKKKFFDQT